MPAKSQSTWSRALTISRPIFQSDMRWKAWGYLGLLLSLALGVSGLNVVNSYVGRDFMTALEHRARHTFILNAFLYLGVFAASTVVGVFYRFTEQCLGLLWRRWLTAYLFKNYLANQTYYRLKSQSEIDNPDQRIAEDVKTFTTTLLSVALMVLNSTLAFLTFAGVLWSISPWLALSALGYSALGCVITLILGRRLVKLNNDQFRKEADFRYELITVRERAYTVALAGLESREEARLSNRLRELARNFKAIVSVDRNIGFFVSFYNYMTPIVPILIVSPLFLMGKVEWGVVTQAAGAFAAVTGALTLIVTQIDSLSAFAAVIARLGSFWEAIEGNSDGLKTSITLVEDDSRIAFESLTLKAADGHVLINDLTLEVPRGRRLLIRGTNGAGKDAIFKATAGLWPDGSGKIARPNRDDLHFLTQQPFSPAGTLREAIVVACRHCDATDREILAAIDKVQLSKVMADVDGLDTERDWSNMLPLGDQERVAIAGLLVADPPFAFLHGATNAIGAEGSKQIYQVLAETSITYISIEDHQELREFHDMILDLHDDGTWELETREPQARSASPRAESVA